MTDLRDVVPTQSIPTASYEVSIRQLADLSLRALQFGFALYDGTLCAQSHSLPSHGRSPFRSWPLVVLCIASSFFCSSMFIL